MEQQIKKLTAYYYRSACVSEDIGKSMQMQRILHHMNTHDVRNFTILVDDGHSGTIMERPAFGQLLILMRMGLLEKVIVTGPDRISRDLHKAIAFFKEAMEYEVAVEDVDGTDLLATFNSDSGCMMDLLEMFKDIALKSDIELNRAWIYGENEDGEPIGEKNFVIDVDYLESIFDELFPEEESMDEFLEGYEPETDGEKIYQRALKDGKIVSEKDTIYSEEDDQE